MADDRTLGLIVDHLWSPLDDGVEFIMPFESGATGHELPESGIDTEVKTSLPKDTSPVTQLELALHWPILRSASTQASVQLQSSAVSMD